MILIMTVIEMKTYLNEIHEEQANEWVAQSSESWSSAEAVENEERKDKNENLWSPEPPIERRRRRENILRNTGGPTDRARKTCLLETWELFFPDEDLSKIVRYTTTNAEVAREYRELFMSTLKAAIGFMHFRGANFAQKVSKYEFVKRHSIFFYQYLYV